MLHCSAIHQYSIDYHAVQPICFLARFVVVFLNGIQTNIIILYELQLYRRICKLDLQQRP